MNQHTNFYSLLVCPRDKTALKLAERTYIEQINRGIAQGKIAELSGKIVTEAIDGGLINQAQDILYPIRQNIPILLIERGLNLGTVK